MSRSNKNNNNTKNSMNHLSEDEALARALQMQYEREAAAAAAAARTRATPPPASLREHRATTGATHRGSSASPGPPPRPRRNNPMTVDEELARRIAAQQEAQQAARAIKASPSGSSSNSRSGSRSRSNSNSRSESRSNSASRATGPTPTATSSGYLFPPDINTSAQVASGGYVFPAVQASVSPVSEIDTSHSETLLDLETEQQQAPPFFHEDEEFARRVEQELQDELVAERLQQKEQERLDRQQQAYLQQQQQPQDIPYPTDQNNRKRKLACGSFIAIAVAVGATIALIYYFVVLGGGVPTIHLTPQDFANEDPFDAMTPEEANAWRNSGHGVQLTVINALETKWYQYFYDAVKDWNTGYPDALTLNTEFNDQGPGAAGHDPICKAVSGKVKVCNGNYGNTRWKGINEVLIDGNGNIIASAARMNEFYLGAGDDDEMQYTMCHEMGHAWGLGHTDETFGNPDLGDCMDYTNNPKANRQPTERNFIFLFRMYGLVDGAEPFTMPTVPPTSSPTASNAVSTQASVVHGGGVRHARHRKNKATSAMRNKYQNSTTIQLSPNQDLPEWLTDAMERVLDRHVGRRLKPQQWRVLTEHSQGASYQTDLGQGFQLRVHYLLHRYY